MKYISILTLLTVMVFGFASSSFAQVEEDDLRHETIAAVVNDDAITGFDVKERLKLVLVSSGMPDRPDLKAKLIPQIISILVDERIKMQEAKRLQIGVTPEEIEKGFEEVARQNNIDVTQFKTLLVQQGASPFSLKQQIEAQIAWTKAVQYSQRSKINLTEKQVIKRRNRMINNIGKTEYLVSEIFLPIENEAQAQNIRTLAERLDSQIQQDNSLFPRLAVQFSQSAGASRGGDMGWVQEGQLPQAIQETVQYMEAGNISAPVRSLAGYHIILMRGKRTITKDTVPSVEELTKYMRLEQLERLQRAYFLDLKSNAFIEYRM